MTSTNGPLAGEVPVMTVRTRPDISDEAIFACLKESYGLHASSSTFLPVGADFNAFAFQVLIDDGTSRFLKLSLRNLSAVAVSVPAFLHSQGISRVMAPIATIEEQLWTAALDYKCVLYPYFDGDSAFQTALSAEQWVVLGATVKAVHGARLPADLLALMPRERYSPRDREFVTSLQRRISRQEYSDPIASRFAALWRAKRDEISRIVNRAEALAAVLLSRRPDLVVCHADLHGGNVLVSEGNDLAIVDWDEVILAPKERDLMFVGAGVGGVWNHPDEVEWFYEGYEQPRADPVALAYYRNERILADFAEYARQILGGQGSPEDRETGLHQLSSQFDPGSVIDIARASDPGGR